MHERRPCASTKRPAPPPSSSQQTQYPYSQPGHEYMHTSTRQAAADSRQSEVLRPLPSDRSGGAQPLHIPSWTQRCTADSLRSPEQNSADCWLLATGCWLLAAGCWPTSTVRTLIESKGTAAHVAVAGEAPGRRMWPCDAHGSAPTRRCHGDQSSSQPAARQATATRHRD
jgi:hypothetical protein